MLPIQASKLPPPPPKIKKAPVVALVLGGGGARGYAHLGVIKVLEQAHIPIQLIVGTSTGSIFGSLYADSANVNKVQQELMPLDFWSVASFGSHPNLQGFINSNKFQLFLFNHMKAHFFRQLKIPFIAVATDIKSGKSVVLRSGLIAPAVAASSSVPGVVIPIHLYGHTLVDGSLTDPVPVDVAKRFKPKIIIAVNIAQNLPQYVPSTAYGVYSRAYNIMYEQLNQDAAEGADVVIRPHVGEVSTFDFSKKRQMILAGEKAARAALPEIKKLLKERS
jgi:NTE family protein